MATAPPPPRLPHPVLQPTVLRQADSFVCRRCQTNRGASYAQFDSPYHFHPELELILIESSTGTRYVADSIEPYRPGDLVLIGSNVPHVFMRDGRANGENGKRETSVVVSFRADFMGADFFERPEMLELRQMFVASAHGLHFDATTAQAVEPRLKRLLNAKGAWRIALLIEILACLAGAPARPLGSGAFSKQIEMKDLARLDRVLTYVSHNFNREITLASAAKVAALTPTSFSRWFKHATTKSFIECLTEIRLGQAYRMLTETSRNVTEVAFDCGFNSVSHFIHRFHAMRGMSPREFRHRVREGLLHE